MNTNECLQTNEKARILEIMNEENEMEIVLSSFIQHHYYHHQWYFVGTKINTIRILKKNYQNDIFTGNKMTENQTFIMNVANIIRNIYVADSFNYVSLSKKYFAF